MAIAELRTKPDRLRSHQAEILRQALLPFETGELRAHVRSLIDHIDRQTATREKWTFVMLSPSQNAAVVNYLARNSSRPLVAVRIWAACFEHLRQDTGEIMLTRDQIAEIVGEEARNVSTIMGELVAFGAVSRKREKVGGMRGPGMARYFMNPRVATHLAGRERDRAQSGAPLLKLIEGRKR